MCHKERPLSLATNVEQLYTAVRDRAATKHAGMCVMCTQPPACFLSQFATHEACGG